MSTSSDLRRKGFEASPPVQGMREESIRSALEAVLASETFVRCKRLAEFLRFAVDQVLQGNGDNLKESVIGVEVFERRPSYNPGRDPIVRVQAGRLRSKLGAYYAEEGRSDPICIELPDRGYAPIFRIRSPELSDVQQSAPVQAWQRVEGMRSIAVLPLANISPNPSEEYFSDGLTQELILALTKIPGLLVVGRASVFLLKERSIDIRQAGSRLNVQTILEGSVRKEQNNVRVTVQLIDVATGYSLWSAAYDRDITAIFLVQEEIADAIREALTAEFADKKPRPPLVRAGTRNIESYKLYLRGRNYVDSRTEEGFRKGIACFLEAIKRDPDYAAAYSGLADTYSLSTRYDYFSPSEAWPMAKTFALKALGKDETLAEAHCALGFVKLHFDWDRPGSQEHFIEAIACNPSYACAHQWNAWCLATMGLKDESLLELDYARILDPLSHNVNADMALGLYLAGRYKEARACCEEMLALDSGFYRAHEILALELIQRKNYSEAIEELQKVASLIGGRNRDLAHLGYVYGVNGQGSEAGKILKKLRARRLTSHVTSLSFAIVEAGLGNSEQSLRHLKRSFVERDGELIWIAINPIYSIWWDMPAFWELVKQFQFPFLPRTGRRSPA